jgi:membrane-associated protease RseP (regulator of RpoE activity)
MSFSTRRILVHGSLLALTVVTTTVAGAIWSGAESILSFDGLARGLPFSLSLLAILLCHELGHYLMCVRYGIDASWPYFLPAPPILIPWGTFGAFIRVRSGFQNRRALFDMGAAGPWAGFVVSVAVLIVGLRLSHVDPTPPTGAMLFFGDSLLTGWLTRVIVGAEPDQVFIHPVGIAGWFGLLVTSLNLIPAGQLDGGHVLYAAVGRRTPLVSGVIAAVLVWLAIRLWPGWLLWAGVIVLMTRLGHPSTADDRLPLGTGRLVGAVASLILLAITFVPEPIRILP